VHDRKQKKLKVLYFITEDWFFCSHFIERAAATRAAGNEVIVMTRVCESADAIRNAGIRVIPLEIQRRSFNPLRETRIVYEVWKAYRKERPDLVHQIALKPILYGTLAAKLAGVPAIINAPVGMGFVFSSSSSLARFLRPVVTIALRSLLNPARSKVVFENGDDVEWAIASKLVRHDAAVLIRGAGIDLTRFRPEPKAAGVPVVLLAARMLHDKGIKEFVEAASILKKRQVPARFVLVGGVDPENPSSLSEDQLKSWAADGVVEWWGHRKDMAAVLAEANIACLPSYREGLPKSLLEAAACGLPIVTTNVPGCREVVEDGVQGLLVPPRDATQLADALARLLGDPELCARMGTAARARTEAEFGRDTVIEQTLALYGGMAS